MAKFVILGDLHLGARNGSNHFSDYFNRFFREVLYPYCNENGIKDIIQLGDIFDSRTSLTLKAYHRCRDAWFKEMQQNGIAMTILLGNHDICYRHSLEINSPELFLGEYDNITIVRDPSKLSIAGMEVDIIPWICDENKKDVDAFLKRKERAPVCFGHLELAGFAMYRGVESHGGQPSSVFDGYSLVFSGHYHTMSQKGNIIYTGIPYEITWSDFADPKGFFVYDTETHQYEFVSNPLRMFEKVVYSNGSNVNIPSLAGKIVKVIVAEKKDPVAYERWLDSIRLVLPYELSIVEGTGSMTSTNEIDDSVELEDTLSIINTTISQIETTVDKDSLKKYMQTLYAEALTLDDSI